MDVEHNDTPLFFVLWNWLKHWGENSPSDVNQAKLTARMGVPGYRLQKLERCWQKECENEINRKKLERCYWQGIPH